MKLLALLVPLALLPASARAGECLLDPDCPGAQICIDEICAETPEPLRPCDVDDDCLVGVCVDGFCKGESLHCADPEGGVCRVGENSFECDCSDGDTFAGVGGSGTEKPPPDPEAMYEECLEQLAMCEAYVPDPGGDGDPDPGESGEPVGDDGKGAETGIDDGCACTVGGGAGSGLLLVLLGLGRRRRP